MKANDNMHTIKDLFPGLFEHKYFDRLQERPDDVWKALDLLSTLFEGVDLFCERIDGVLYANADRVFVEPTAVVELYAIYPDYDGRRDVVFNVHNGSLFGADIIWQGVKYSPLPMEIEGFEAESNGRLSRPKIRISNKFF